MLLPWKCSSWRTAATRIPVQVGETSTPLKELLSKNLKQADNLRMGQLANGFSYVMLPNKVPPQRFEAHLEMHAGTRQSLAGLPRKLVIITPLDLVAAAIISKCRSSCTPMLVQTCMHHVCDELVMPALFLAPSSDLQARQTAMAHMQT